MSVVRRAEVRGRRVVWRTPLETHASKLSPDGLGVVEESGHVLDENSSSCALPDDSDEFGPEGSLVVVGASFPGEDVRLARETDSDEIHEVTPLAAIEGREIVPDRRSIQGLVFHPRHEDGRRESVPLDVAHGSKPQTTESVGAASNPGT